MNPQIYDAIKSAINAGLHVSLPARIESFDSVTQTCTCQPMVKDTTQSGAYVPFPVLVGLPVQFPGGSQFTVTFPLAQGDEGLVVFSDIDTGAWLDTGNVSTPDTPRQHHLSDGFFLPGTRSNAKKLSEFKTDAIVVGKQGDVGVRVSASKVELGVTHSESATEAAVLGTAQKTAIDSLVDNLKSAIDAMLTTGANSGGPVAFAGTPAFAAAWSAAKASYDAAQTLSTKVKVK